MAIIYYVDGSNNYYIDNENNYFINTTFDYNKYRTILYINGEFKKVKPCIFTKRISGAADNSLVTMNDEIFLTSNDEYFITAGMTAAAATVSEILDDMEQEITYSYLYYKPYIAKEAR